MYKHGIMNRLNLDRTLAILLDKGMGEVKRQALEQGKNVYQGIQRITWYTSCLTDNYQDVCANLKHEDIRFVKSVIQAIKRHDVIFDIVHIYIKYLIGDLTPEEERNISRKLAHFGGKTASVYFTNQGLAYSVTVAMCSSLSMTIAMEKKLGSRATIAVAAASYYGRVTEAANAANRLQASHPIFFQSLYHEELEMLYFLVEDVVGREFAYYSGNTTAGQIAETINRLVEQ